MAIIHSSASPPDSSWRPWGSDTAPRRRIAATQPSAPAGKTAEIAECSQQDFTGKTILLVEDNELNADIARELLEMTGAHIEWAEDGKLAVDMIDSVEDGYYDMVLMDIQMPVMNGYEAASAIRALDKKKSAQVPIVALSANAFVEDVRKCLAHGMNDHIAKPLDVDITFSKIAKYYHPQK